MILRIYVDLGEHSLSDFMGRVDDSANYFKKLWNSWRGFLRPDRHGRVAQIRDELRQYAVLRKTLVNENGPQDRKKYIWHGKGAGAMNGGG